MFLIRLNLKPESSYIGLCRLALVQLFCNSGSPLDYNYKRITETGGHKMFKNSILRL